MFRAAGESALEDGKSASLKGEKIESWKAGECVIRRSEVLA